MACRSNYGISRFLLALSILWTVTASAQLTKSHEPKIEITVGAEIEFRSELLLKKWTRISKDNFAKSTEKAEQMRLVRHMQTLCPSAKCRIEKVKSKWASEDDYRVIFSDGWWFQIGYDQSCIEINTKPSTLNELERVKTVFNRYLFGAARDLGFYTRTKDIHHYNIGVTSAFGESVESFLRFFVDFSNHPDLALGSLGKQLGNAPPLSILGDEQRNALQVVIDKFYQGAFKAITQLGVSIQNTVYSASFVKAWGMPWHFQALGLRAIARGDLEFFDVPLEFRGVWAQQSAEHFILVGRLIEGRIHYLQRTQPPIIYTQSNRWSFTETELNTRFFLYVTESGLPYEKFKYLLRQNVRRAEFAPFISRSAHLEDRLSSLEQYWDLLPVSDGFREHVVHLLQENSKHPRAMALRNRIDAELRATEELIVQGQQKNRGFLSKLKTLTFGSHPDRNELLAGVLRQLSTRLGSPERARPIFSEAPVRIDSASSCSGIFN